MDKCLKCMNCFCIMCGKFSVNKNMFKFSGSNHEKRFTGCFNISNDVLDNFWVPKFICGTCASRLNRWENGTQKMCFSSPAIWREPEIHDRDCYFCINYKMGLTSKTRRSGDYVVTSSVTLPVLVNANSHLPIAQDVSNIASTSHNDHELMEVEETEQSSLETDTDDDDDEEKSVDFGVKDDAPSRFNQKELSDLVRDLYLSKEQSELLASRLKEKRCLEKGTKVTYYRSRDQHFRKYFTQAESLVYCNDIDGLLKELGAIHLPEEWRLFIDSSKISLKAVLLHNGNKLASVPIGHSTILNENYSDMKFLLQKLNYELYRWKICTDLKVVTILMGQQAGYTKYPCFLCKWDSRARADHYKRKVWPSRNDFVVGENNIVESNLVDSKNIILPPLHIKLGLIKQFIKALKNRESDAFKYLFVKFPKISEAKIKEGIFDGPQVRQLIRDPEFAKRMSMAEKKAWESFVNVCNKFLGNNRDKNYEKIVKDLIVNYDAIGCLMSLKLHFLDSHLEYFPENLGDYSEEQGERFHQDIKEMERRYQGFWDNGMMADYCWNLKRETSGGKHKRRAMRRSFQETCKPHKKAYKD